MNDIITLHKLTVMVPPALKEMIEDVQALRVFEGIVIGITFKNGWGASLIRHNFSRGGDEGLWELAVIGTDGQINYTHPVADGGVRGHLSEAEALPLLMAIATTKVVP